MKAIPVLRVFDYAKAIGFYIDWLGFKINWEHKPVDGPFYMQVSMGEVVLNLSEHHGECSPGACVCITGFTALTEYHQSLTSREYKFMNPGLEKQDWDPNTLQMTVIDPFFNKLIFTEPVSPYKKEKGSSTSIGAAMMRAAHQLLDGEPLLLNDPVIVRLLEPSRINQIEENRDWYFSETSQKLRAHMVLRSRYAEDRLKIAVENGTRQYLIMGAGFDTFAYRQPEWAETLQIVELDHPLSQADKLKRLTESGIAAPSNLTYVPIDFEKTNIRNVLTSPVFNLNESIFISWLGVSMYLTTESVDAVFAFVATLAKGSEMVFTYSQKKAPGKPDTVAEMAAAAGEPWLSRFHPHELYERLNSHGFSEIYFPDQEEIARQYFAGQQLQAPKAVSIVRVKV